MDYHTTHFFFSSNVLRHALVRIGVWESAHDESCKALGIRPERPHLDPDFIVMINQFERSHLLDTRALLFEKTTSRDRVVQAALKLNEFTGAGMRSACGPALEQLMLACERGGAFICDVLELEECMEAPQLLEELRRRDISVPKLCELALYANAKPQDHYVIVATCLLRAAYLHAEHKIEHPNCPCGCQGSSNDVTNSQ